MKNTLHMGGGSVEDDWPELEPDRRQDQVDDPDADPNLTGGAAQRPLRGRLFAQGLGGCAPHRRTTDQPTTAGSPTG